MGLTRRQRDLLKMAPPTGVAGHRRRAMIAAGPAIPDSVIEDFERDNPISDYVGDTNDFAETQTDVIQGDYALKYDDPGSGGPIIHTDFTVEGAPPQRGDTVAFLRHGGGLTGALLLDADEWTNNTQISGYYFRENNDDLEIWRVDDGSLTSLGTDAITGGHPNDWTDIEVSVDGNNITADLYKIDATPDDFTFQDREDSPSASVTVEDATYNWGRYGWRIGESETVDPANDYLRVMDRA